MSIAGERLIKSARSIADRTAGMSIFERTHGARVATTATGSELTMSPAEGSDFCKLIRRLDLYRTYHPQTQDDQREILTIAKMIQKALEP